jgi:hypothetical protein
MYTHSIHLITVHRVYYFSEPVKTKTKQMPLELAARLLSQ